jgi:replication initiation and membrane attachment protein
MSLSTLQSSLRKLEAIGLLNTYQKDSMEVCFLYELLLPLSPQQFYQHQILNTLLYKKLGKEDYQKTSVCFTSFTTDKSNYKNITAIFQDVFSIDLHSEVKNGLVERKYLQIQTNPIEKEYPLALFYEGLHHYQIKKDCLNKEDENLIQQLGILYRVNVLDMQGMVKKALQNDVLNHQILIEECHTYYDLQEPTTFNNIHHTQPAQYKSVKGNTSKDSHIAYLENISPMGLLKAKQGGKEPLRKDIVIIESLLTKLQLQPGVINVLIEMTLHECDNTLPRRYMEHYGGQWLRKKITTVKEAMKEAKQIMRAKEKHKIILPALEQDKTVYTNENTVDEE